MAPAERRRELTDDLDALWAALPPEIQNDLQKLFQTVLTLQVASKGRRQHFEELSQIVGDALLFHAERAGDLLSGVVARVPLPVQRMSITP